MEAGGEEAAAEGEEAGQAAPAPGVVLEIAREGRLVGRLELGLREAKDKVMLSSRLWNTMQVLLRM